MNAAFRKLGTNTPEEEAAIQRGIDMDPDTYVLSDEEFEQLRPFVRRTFEMPTAHREPDAA